MRVALVVVGMIMFVAGLVALYFGVTSMSATPCWVDATNCDPNAGSNTAFFPIGLASIILGACSWTAGSSQLFGALSKKDPLNFIGFFGIFGMTFLGVGLVMFIADQQPTADHTTNVLTILGIIFGIVGIGSIVVEVLGRVATASSEQILATGIRGRATVLAVRDANVTVNFNPMIAMDLRVEIPGQPVFTKTIRQVISRLDVGSYRPGLVLPIAADPKRPQEFVVDWDHVLAGARGTQPDPVTGQPVASPATSFSGSLAPALTMGGQHVPSGDIAGILRTAADQVAAGGSAAHPAVAGALGNAAQWSGGASMSPADVAALLRSVADRVAAGGTGATAGQLAHAVSLASGTAPGTAPMAASSAADATITSEQLATMLRHASEAAAQAAREAEAGGSGATGATGTGAAT